MRELLERWARLEPERCGVSKVGDFHVFDVEEGRSYIIYLDDPEMFDQVNDIQAIVQKAIRARGLNFIIYGYYTNKLWSDAAVVWDGNIRYRSDGKSDAENLLSAYLQALEVN